MGERGKARVRRAATVLFLLVSGAALGWLMWKNGEDLKKSMLLFASPQRLPYLAGILALSVLNPVSTVGRYKLYFPKSSFKDLYHSLCATLFLHYGVPSKFGLPLRILLLHKVAQVPVVEGTVFVAADTLMSYLVTGLMATVGAFFLFPQHLTAMLVGMGALVGVGAAAWVLRRVVASRWAWLGSRLARAEEALRALTLRELLLNGALAAGNALLGSARVAMILWALGVDIGLGEVIGAATLVYMIATVALVPMGLGVREVSFVLLLSQLGVPQEAATAAALIDRACTTGLWLLMGAVSANLIGVSTIQSWTKREEG